MKVGVFLEDFTPETGGGYTIQADIFHALVQTLNETEHTFVLFCRQPEMFERFIGPQLKSVAFPGTFSERALAKAQRSVRSLVDSRKSESRLEELSRAEGIDLMWFVGAEALQIDIPYIGIVWDLQHRLQPWFPEVSSQGTWKNRESFYGEYLRRATFIIAGTHAGQQEIERFYQITSNRIKVLPHPTPSFALAPVDSETQTVKKKFGIVGEYVFYPAQFWSHKNHVNLLLAISKLKAEHHVNLSVVFVGSNKGNKLYVEEFAAKLQPEVDTYFLGFVSVDDLVALYREAFALTYVSYFGPENLPPLEAFALGCPVVAANVSGASEQLGDAAILVDPSDPAAIADALKKLREDDQLRSALVRRGRDRAHQWTAKEFVTEVLRLLDDFAKVRRCWGNN